MTGGGCKGGELPFIYKTLDLDCVETVCFENLDVVANSGMRCDVNLKMTYFLRGKQFCIAFKSTFCYFVIPCNLIWILLLPFVTHLCYTYLCHNIDIFIDAIEIYSYVLFLKDTLFIITLKSYLTEYIDIALSDLVFLYSKIVG